MHEIEQGRHVLEALGERLAAGVVGTCSAPPVVEPHHDLVGVRDPPARAWNVASAARRISSRAIACPPTSSPSYSSSILPVIAGSAA